jgi:hypothetical protein
MPTNLHPSKPKIPLALSMITLGLPSTLVKNRMQKNQQQRTATTQYQQQQSSNNATDKQPT